MKYDVLITDKASEDMDNIYNHIVERDKESDNAVIQYEYIFSEIMSLSEMPTRIKIMNTEPEHSLEVRLKVAKVYNILFQIRGKNVVILRVLHSRQDLQGKLL